MGAESVWNVGDYYGWGELVPFTGEYNSYRIFDKITILPSNYDIATITYGSDWRLPTKEEFEELINGDNTRVETVIIQGLTCKKIVSLKTQQSIILPIRGYRSSSGILNRDSGYYWSATKKGANGSGPEGTYWGIYYLSIDNNSVRISYMSAHNGLLIRPIVEK